VKDILYSLLIFCAFCFYGAIAVVVIHFVGKYW
jgi:hypothetical protein